MVRGLFALFTLLLLASASVAHAQMDGDPLSVSLSPQYPKPFQTVGVTVRSSMLDLSASRVTVSVNGTVVEQGTGVLTAYVRAGAAGEATRVRVSVASGGQTYTEDLVIRPADVALVVEPQTTSHPFYRGLALVAPEGQVRLVAIPDIRTAGGAVPPSSLVYTWRLGTQVLESSSGIGRNVLSATAPVKYRDATVSVTVSTQDASVVAQATTQIAPADPFVRIYRNDPLLGPLFDRALSSPVVMLSDEETFRMVPYHFASRPNMSWAVNSVDSGGSEDITVRSTGQGAGSALLSAFARRPENYQSAESTLSIRFGEGSPLGIFGL